MSDDDDFSAADDMLDGLCCDQCGEFFNDMESQGHPRTCELCKAKNRKRKR